MFIKITDSSKEYPYPLDKLQFDFPNVSFPVPLNAQDLTEYGVFPVKLKDIDVVPTPLYEKSVELDPVLINGVWTQQWGVVALNEDEKDEAKKALRALAKEERDAAVAAIVVTTSTGKQFNGDETSQTRMSRAIVAMQAASANSTIWVLADNTATEVTLTELSEALVLAGQAQAAIWVLPD